MLTQGPQQCLGCRLRGPGLADLGTGDGELPAVGPLEMTPVEVDAGVLVGGGLVLTAGKLAAGVAAGDSSGTGGKGISGVGTSLKCATGDCRVAGEACRMLGDACGVAGDVCGVLAGERLPDDAVGDGVAAG